MPAMRREPLTLGWHPSQLGVGLDEDGGSKAQSKGSTLLAAAKAMERDKGWAK